LVAGIFRQEKNLATLAKLTSYKKPRPTGHPGGQQPAKNSLLSSAFVHLPPALLKPLTKKQQ